ncbi:transposase [Streptomyces galbus]|uniref:Transposase n=1 Tax=Streptomyces galbus TaxID=33898 RepID=A0ABX1ILJ8_STRGB|nr:transposase [Streptomyces galbus]
MADRARTLRPLGRRRHPRPAPCRSPAAGGGRLAGRPGLHHRAGPPAHRRQRGLEERGLGRSRGGLTSKIHRACDGRGRPLPFAVTAGIRNDCTQAEAVIDEIRVTRRRPGRPASARSGWWPTKATRPAPSAPTCADAASRRPFPNASTNSRADADAANGRAASTRPSTRRNVVERCFHRLKQRRGIATHYDKQPDRYLTAITLDSTLIGLQK